MKKFLEKLFGPKQPEIKFVCLIPEVAKSMPIVPASKVNFSWVRTAVENYKRQKAQQGNGAILRHVARCPGIHAVSRVGWVQKSYQDIFIKTDGSGGFGWKTPIDQSKLTPGHEFVWDYITYHSNEMTEPYGLVKPGAIPTIIKVQSPWVVYIPKGYYLMCMPIPYGDDNRFTATTGILDGDNGPIFLNVQMHWYCQNSEELIPAGTPLAQYYLIKKEEINEVVSGFTEETIEDLRLRRMTVESQFIPTYSKLKNTNFDTEI